MTPKQAIKVKAALAVIYANGADAQGVNRTAKAYIAKGQAPAKAYELALNAFATATPDVGAMIGRVTRLVQASDSHTLAQYDAALTRYDDTGDDSGLNALAPMFDADLAALDARGPDAGMEDAPPAPPASFAFQPPQPVASTPAPGSYRAVNGTQTGSVGTTGYSPPKTGEALARQVGLPMAFVAAQQGQPA